MPANPVLDIDLLVRARYPLLYIVTWEEERAIQDLQRIAGKWDRKLYLWSYAQGALRDADGREREMDPLEAVDELMKSNEERISVFCDFHPFLEGRHDRLVRKIREFAATVKDSSQRKMIVIIAPVLKVPVELAKVMAVLDYPL